MMNTVTVFSKRNGSECMLDLQLMATTTFGVETVVKEEIKNLGYDIKEVKNGKIIFTGDKLAICRANLWLRSAERVLLKIGEFPATDFDQLYEKTKELPWSDWLPENAEFPVNGKSVKSKLHHVPSCQSIAKKAIVDNMHKKYGKKWFKEDGALYKIEVALFKDKATLTIDTSGSGLHKRGYRDLNTTAPLQETIAAAMIDLSRWHEDRILIDPFCGSGTIPIEAALMARNIAPGRKRNFAAEDWPNIPGKLWEKAREEAEDKINSRELEPRLIMGTDFDKEVIKIAQHHARRAEVEDIIHFQQKDFSKFSTARKYGYIITNPPYGERMDTENIEKLYKEMGKKLLPLSTWSFYILTSHSDFASLFGKNASKKRKLYNGGIRCNYYQYYGPWPPKSN